MVISSYTTWGQCYPFQDAHLFMGSVLCSMGHEVGAVVSIEWRTLISSCTKLDSLLHKNAQFFMYKCGQRVIWKRASGLPNQQVVISPRLYISSVINHESLHLIWSLSVISLLYVFIHLEG